jgi:hypothetical protein
VQQIEHHRVGLNALFRMNLLGSHSHLHEAATMNYSYKAEVEVQHKQMKNNNFVVHRAAKDGVSLWPRT